MSEEQVYSVGFNRLIMTMETVLQSNRVFCGAIHGNASLPPSLKNLGANALINLFNMVVHYAGMKEPEHPRVVHEKSIMNRMKEGWSRGEEFDEENKKSPLMTTFEDTPAVYQDELHIIAALSQALLKNENQNELIAEFKKYLETVTVVEEDHESFTDGNKDADQGINGTGEDVSSSSHDEQQS